MSKYDGYIFLITPVVEIEKVDDDAGKDDWEDCDIDNWMD